jgi:hypothetical protein
MIQARRPIICCLTSHLWDARPRQTLCATATRGCDTGPGVPGECSSAWKGAACAFAPTAGRVRRVQQSCVDEDDAWELEQSLGLGSREILVARVVEAVPLAVAVEEVRAQIILVLRQREPFEGAAVPRRCSSTRATASPPATRSASASRRPDAAVPRFDLAPGAYLRLLDRACPQW